MSNSSVITESHKHRDTVNWWVFVSWLCNHQSKLLAKNWQSPSTVDSVSTQLLLIFLTLSLSFFLSFFLSHSLFLSLSVNPSLTPYLSLSLYIYTSMRPVQKYIYVKIWSLNEHLFTANYTINWRCLDVLTIILTSRLCLDETETR